MAIIILVVVIGGSLAAFLGNDVKVKSNSDMTYYLKLSYDGVDKNGLQSDDKVVSELKSGYLYVEDKIPEDLTFEGFLTTSDGSIGAVKRSDGSVCVGKVVDDTNTNGEWNADMTEYTYHGLHYDVRTRTVSYKVKDLKAGCDLTIGILTKTPKKTDTNVNGTKYRRDFYNFALARDGENTIMSNNVHAFMGDEFGSLYTVSYEYTGDVPNVGLPDSEKYIAGVKVNVPLDIKVDGYTFNGWESDDVSIYAGKYETVSKDMVLKGNFTKKDTHKVEYKITGEVPSEYILPKTKEYYSDKVIKLDSLKVGTVINGYRFMGWYSDEVAINDNSFVMPNTDVSIIGKFEEAKYTVSYAFYNKDLPANYKNYLPKSKEYYPGDIVEIENNVSSIVGYKFLGWYMDESFIMPNDNITIYGEWKKESITVEPVIDMEIVNVSDYYRLGDNVLYKITVTNNSIFDINDVLVKSNSDNLYFLDNDTYNILSDHIVEVSTIKSGNSTIIYAQYDISSDDEGTIENEVEIVGITSDNGASLSDGNFIATSSFKVMPKINICNNISGYDSKNIFQYIITGDNYETWVKLKNNECSTLYVLPGNYKVKEVVPQEYEIKNIDGIVNSNNKSFEVEEDSNNSITYVNKFKYKTFYHAFGRSIGKILGGE